MRGQPVAIGTGGQAMSEAAPMLVRQTLRAGQEIRHAGSVIIVGDVNPGASIIASGDVVVVGQLRGSAWAGAGGDEQATIIAFRLRPQQLRIANHVARPPDSGDDAPDAPELAAVLDGALTIAPYRSQLRQIRTAQGGSAQWGRSTL